jgi:hypothetical protein
MPLQLDRLVRVEFGRKRMVRAHRARGQHETNRHQSAK